VDLKAAAVAGLIALPACYEGVPERAADATDGADTDGAGNADGDDGGGSDDTGVPDADGCDVPDAAVLRRLTATEYVGSVRDLLGVDATDVASAFPADAAVDGFTNNASVQSFLLQHARSYQDAAETVAERLEPDALGCAPDNACVRAFIERFAAAAFRRPTEDVDVDGLVALAAEANDPFAGARLAVRAVLQSPRFLFRVERGDALDGWEIATRLSYFLWQTTPDAWLRERAADGTLDTVDGVADVARQMLGEDATRGAIAELASGWLRLSDLEDVGRSPQTFPMWSPELREAMRAEVVGLVVDATLGAGTLSDLFVRPPGDADPPLSELYGNEGDRAGVIGTAAFLTLTTPSDVTSPVRRGMFVWDALLCSPLPPPPPGVVGELPPPQDVPKADALAQHRADAQCAVCHDLLDPIGLGLERYDALGRHRERDEGGEPVVQSGEVPLADGAAFGGAAELGAILAERPEARRCFATAVFRWAQGRTETGADACTLDALQEAEDFGTLVQTLVTSDAFRRRR
jgi:hypothetical protein